MRDASISILMDIDIGDAGLIRDLEGTVNT